MKVGVIMGSVSDYEVMAEAVVIAHRAHNHAYFHMNSFFISLKTRLLSGRRTGAGTPRPASAPESRLSDG